MDEARGLRLSAVSFNSGKDGIKLGGREETIIVRDWDKAVALHMYVGQ